MLRIVLFFAASVVILALSWRSLGNVRAHGFYRFFAFEFLSGLILLNAPAWFHDPFSGRQLAAWLLAALSILLAIEGFRLLRILGRPAPIHDKDSGLVAFENTSALVTVGVYRWIRHPLYASLLALAWCAYLKNPLSVFGIALTLAACGFLLATAVAEERENRVRFGAAYAEYSKRTRRFIPFLF